MISGSQFANWLANPSSWFGLHRLVLLVLDLPLWMWVPVLACSIVEILEPKRPDKVEEYTAKGKAAVYLFGADSEEEFTRKWEEEQQRRVAPRTM
jgi:hypothetical protein